MIFSPPTIKNQNTDVAYTLLSNRTDLFRELNAYADISLL